VGDAGRLQQVVSNLLANAIKFTPPAGRVTVRVAVESRTALIVVEDTGQGIPADVLPYVFDRFRQGDSSSTRRHGGLGLGLALVRHLTELHGGSVTGASEGAGRGAVFTVRLPVAPGGAGTGDDPSHPAARPETEGALAGLRVVVVDDDGDSLDVIGAMLQAAGAEVRTCASAMEGLDALAAWAPDVVLSDLEMGGEDGFGLLRRARSLPGGQRCPIAALSAYARADDRARALRAGFDLHVSKPVDAADLVSAVARLAGRSPRVHPRRSGGSAPAEEPRACRPSSS
jgi:CheY-like chemotaxis protein